MGFLHFNARSSMGGMFMESHRPKVFFIVLSFAGIISGRIVVFFGAGFHF